MSIKYPVRSGLILAAALLGAGELVARFVLGLGSPPLTQAHPQIEYLFQPNQDVQRFGNRVLIHNYGMRSENFPIAKPSGEFRVMVFGDSVLNGGNLTDHAKLATTLLASRLATAKGVPVVVGNISAGSWGPGNWLAYAREYGFFDADIVMLLISSHDVGDNPTFAPLNPNTHPQVRPLSALVEGVTRYLPKYLPEWIKADTGDPTVAPAVAADDQVIAQGTEDLRAFFSLARSQVPRVLVSQFPDRGELRASGPQPGYDLIRSIALQSGAEVFSLFPAMKAALDRGLNPYRDNIHVNAQGQAILADAFYDALMEPELALDATNKPHLLRAGNGQFVPGTAR